MVSADVTCGVVIDNLKGRGQHLRFKLLTVYRDYMIVVLDI